MEELKTIMQKFAASGWDLIADPAREWLDGKSNKDTLVSAIKQADEECGNCGCELDQLYKRALELLCSRRGTCMGKFTLKFFSPTLKTWKSDYHAQNNIKSA